MVHTLLKKHTHFTVFSVMLAPLNFNILIVEIFGCALQIKKQKPHPLLIMRY